MVLQPRDMGKLRLGVRRARIVLIIFLFFGAFTWKGLHMKISLCLNKENIECTNLFLSLFMCLATQVLVWGCQ